MKDEGFLWLEMHLGFFGGLLFRVQGFDSHTRTRLAWSS